MGIGNKDREVAEKRFDADADDLDLNSVRIASSAHR
jgi:hypothetical protein